MSEFHNDVVQPCDGYVEWVKFLARLMDHDTRERRATVRIVDGGSQGDVTPDRLLDTRFGRLRDVRVLYWRQ